MCCIMYKRFYLLKTSSFKCFFFPKFPYSDDLFISEEIARIIVSLRTN